MPVTRTLCGGAWLSLTGDDNNGNSKSAFDDLGTSTARYGCCPIGYFMSNPFIALSKAASCTSCDTLFPAANDATTVLNDEISCNNNKCPKGMVYLDTFYGCVRKLPNGDGCPYDGFQGCSRKSTDDTLNSVVDRWLNAATRSSTEAIYGPIGDWDVSSATNFQYLFWKKTTDAMKKIDISKWNLVAAENMVSMFEKATSFNGDVSQWQTGAVTDMRFLFKSASSFNGDLSNWHVKKVSIFLIQL